LIFNFLIEYLIEHLPIIYKKMIPFIINFGSKKLIKNNKNAVTLQTIFSLKLKGIHVFSF